MKTYDFKVGDKCWYLNGGLIYTGKISGIDEHFYTIAPTFNGAGLPDPWEVHERVFPRPSAAKEVLAQTRDYIISIKYDMEYLETSIELAREVDTISTGFVDVLNEGSGEGEARCGKCRTKFEWSVFTSEGVTWDEESGNHKLECPECAKTAPIE
jgi:hypothetical protein